ncbi:MAG: hypothetical protein HUU46_13520 [Candidatus Hydrogenedentes bacterium]|nr:hypothetical protein [Candidatus Hydrogenedentota bacterium]
MNSQWTACGGSHSRSRKRGRQCASQGSVRNAVQRRCSLERNCRIVANRMSVNRQPCAFTQTPTH